MDTSTIEQTVQFQATPQQVYQAIMDSALHSEFTQSESQIGENVGDKYSAYDGYIEGTILELQKDKLIRKSWMAYEDGWPEGHFSEITFRLSEKDGGTEMKFTHDGVPSDKLESFRSGWIEHYWEPMKALFEKQISRQ